MAGREQVLVSRAEARGLMLAAQGLLDPPPERRDLAALGATVDQLGAVQLDAISVVARSPYLVLWSRLGAHDPGLLDAALHPHRAIFEYWSHAASLVPMADYPYYRRLMLEDRAHPWYRVQEWLARHPELARRTLDLVRERGPLASADFEASPDGQRAEAWDWYGPKETRRMLELLWSSGELMVHSRRAGQKLYDLRERVLAEAFGGRAPRDEDLPSFEEALRFFARRTLRALGLVAPSWLRDYFRLPAPGNGERGGRAMAAALLDALVAEGEAVRAAVEGLREPLYLHRARLPDLARLRGGHRPERTTLLSPFDSLIWHRPRTRALFDYEVAFEAYLPPARRRFGYYCLAILHQGELVGRLDPKYQRRERCLRVRALHLEPKVVAGEMLVAGLATALRDLARFVGAEAVVVERSAPEALAPALQECLSGRPAPGDLALRPGG